MEEEEPDYLSDEFLAQCIPKDVRPGLLFKHGEKRKHELLKKDSEKRLKSRKEIEEEQREEGFRKEIPSDNKGFVLLQKMGYKPGTTIGKSQEGLKNPLEIEFKSNRKGLGHKSQLEDMMKKRVEISDPNTFRARFQSNTLAREIDRDLSKAKSTCRDLDSRLDKDPPHLWYWPKVEKEVDDVVDKDDNEKEKEDDTISQLEPPVQLNLISTYLRETYFYCIWCGVKYENDEDMNSSCAGPEKEDH